jgi:MFS family permease
LVGLSSALVAMLTYSTVFILAEPAITCYQKETNILAYNFTLQNDSLNSAKETCKIWDNIIDHVNNTNDFASITYQNITCSFDRSYYGLSIVNEWGLVCKKKYLATQTQSFYLAGTFTGLIFGPLSDKYGRKFLSILLLTLLSSTLIVSEVLMLNFVNLSVNTQYIVLSVSQFILGSCGNSIYSFLFILLIEFSTKEFTTIITNTNLYMFVIGELLVMSLSYFLRNWHFVNWESYFFIAYLRKPTKIILF